MKTFKEYNKTRKVFLGGTCNGSSWRETLKQLLGIKFYDPVVSDWNEDAKREDCDYCLYVITPKLKGFYSIAEATEDSIKRPEKTIFCYLNRDGDDLIKRNGGQCFKSLSAVSVYLNNHE